ncbi:MAG: NAD(P)/FAD-dependent oxidoreductase, partial [Candidatus Saccharimonadales bacterium]
DLCQPIAELIKNSAAKIMVAEAHFIDFEHQIVRTDKSDLPYDYLVLAVGSRTNFFSVPGAEAHSLVLENTSDSAKICQQITANAALAQTTAEQDLKRKLLTSVIVGAGPTGAELAVKINQLLGKIKPPNLTDQSKTYVIEKAGELFPALPKRLRVGAAAILKREGVSLIAGVNVVKVGADYLELAGRQRLEAKNIIWAAGVKPVLPDLSDCLQMGSTGRILVDNYLRVRGHKNVFALGDVASFQNTTGETLPSLAQVAIKQSRYVARNIVHLVVDEPLEVFDYKLLGLLIPLGHHRGVGKLLGLNISGPLVRLAVNAAYIKGYPLFKNKLKLSARLVRPRF